MPDSGPQPGMPISPRAVQLAIGVASLVMLAGLLLPGVRTWRHVRKEHEALAQMEAIRDGIRRFIADTGVPPTRAKNGDPAGVYRLLGPGMIAEGSYYYPDRHQGHLADPLVDNTPLGRRQPGYGGWKGPYVALLSADPWGFAYVVVTYPLVSPGDDRDCIVVSAGPNGRMDGTYSSPRDVVAAGDDLVVVIADQSSKRGSP